MLVNKLLTVCTLIVTTIVASGTPALAMDTRSLANTFSRTEDSPKGSQKVSDGEVEAIPLSNQDLTHLYVNSDSNLHEISLSFVKDNAEQITKLQIGLDGTENIPGIDFNKMDAYVLQKLKSAAIPGLAYGIVHRDQIIHMQAFGVADNGGHPVTAQTLFEVGSVAKTFTALAIRQLINEGKVELDAPVQRYIPWFRLADPEAASTISIRQLLSHTSGLSWADGNRAVFSDEGYTIEEFVRMMDTMRPNRPAGSSSEYCNLNYLLLGEVVQLVSGLPFTSYIKTNILQPLKMEHTFLSKADAIQAGFATGLATGYHIWYGFPVPMKAGFPSGAAPFGTVISSVEDMTHYLVAYLNQGSYQDNSVLLPVSSTASTRAANWYDIHWNESFRANDRYSEGQSGGTYNFNGGIQIMGNNSRGEYGIVVLTNTNPDFLVQTVEAMSFVKGIESLLLNGQVERISTWDAIKWYFWWGLVDLTLLALVILALFELFTFRQWTLRKNGDKRPTRLLFFTRTGIDALAGVFAVAALPIWQQLPWRDLLKPFCELCPILISTGTILITVAVVKIAIIAREDCERSRTNKAILNSTKNSNYKR